MATPPPGRYHPPPMSSAERIARREMAVLPRPRTWVVVMAVSACSYLAVLAVVVARGLADNHGHFVYALDDAYIHLAMARTLADHGSWGVVPGDFESASSSPAWTLALAGLMRVTARGASVLPLVLNVALALLVVALFVRGQPLLRQSTGRGWALAVAALLPLALLLPALTVLGMEAIAAAALAVALLALLQRIVEGRDRGVDRACWWALLAALPLVRLEGLFLAAGCALALLLERRTRVAVLTAAIPAMSAAVVAAVDLAHGQYALPNSVVAKSLVDSGGLAALVPSLPTIADRLSTDGMLVALLAALAAYVALSFAGGPRRHRALGAAVLVAAALHCAYADLGSVDRYQAYLVAAALFTAIRILGEVTPPGWRALAPVLLLAPLVLLPVHKYVLTGQVSAGMNNVYQQQLQMATFLESRYPDQPVAVNDIGLVGYRHRGPLLDLAGLASFDVLRQRRAGTFDRAAVARAVTTHGVHVVALYENWFHSQIPAQWTLVAQWAISGEDVTIGAPVLSWYAPSAADVDVLVRRLHTFDGQLPPEVLRRYLVSPSPAAG